MYNLFTQKTPKSKHQNKVKIIGGESDTKHICDHLTYKFNIIKNQLDYIDKQTEETATAKKILNDLNTEYKDNPADIIINLIIAAPVYVYLSEQSKILNMHFSREYLAKITHIEISIDSDENATNANNADIIEIFPVLQTITNLAQLNMKIDNDKSNKIHIHFKKIQESLNNLYKIIKDIQANTQTTNIKLKDKIDTIYSHAIAIENHFIDVIKNTGDIVTIILAGKERE